MATSGRIEISPKPGTLKKWANSVDICLWGEDNVSKAFIHIYRRVGTDVFVLEVHKSCTIRSPEDVKLTF